MNKNLPNHLRKTPPIPDSIIQVVARFRSYDKRNGRWSSSGAFYNNSTMQLEAISDLVVMQSAGMTDMGMEEYFEEDVFQIEIGKNKGNVHIVVKNFGSFGYYDKNQKWKLLYEVSDRSVIIGNVFDKPELKMKLQNNN